MFSSLSSTDGRQIFVQGGGDLLIQVRGGSSDEEVETNERDEEDVDEDEEETDEDEDEEEGTDWVAVAKDVSEKAVDVTQTMVVPVLVKFSKKAYRLAMVLSIKTYRALQRAYRAGFDGDEDEEEEAEEDEEEEEVSISVVLAKYVTKTFKVAKRMVVAALDFSGEKDEDNFFGDDDDDVDVDEDTEIDDDDKNIDTADKSDRGNTKATTTDKKTKSVIDADEDENASDAIDENKKQDDTTATKKAPSDFGRYLSETYDVADEREDSKKKLDIWGGTFKDALQNAQDQARLLVVFIPATQPKPKGGFSFFGGGGGNQVDEKLLEKDKQAIESFFSKEVAKAAARKPLKKGDKSLGSFAVWSAKNGSPEANEVFRRLKVTETSTKGKKRPIICVVYPSYVSSMAGQWRTRIHQFDCLIISYIRILNILTCNLVLYELRLSAGCE